MNLDELNWQVEHAAYEYRLRHGLPVQGIDRDSRLYEDLLKCNQPERAERHPADDGDAQDEAYSLYVARSL